MNDKEFEEKNRERILRQYRSNQGRSPRQEKGSLKIVAIVGIVLIILILYML